MKTEKGFYVIEGCFGWFLSKEPSEGYVCGRCGTYEMDIGYAKTIEEATILIHQFYCGVDGFDIEDEYDLESFIETWVRVAEKWQEYF